MSGIEKFIANSAGTGNLSALSFAILGFLLYLILSERGTRQVSPVVKSLPAKVYSWYRKQSIQILYSSNNFSNSNQNFE